MNEKDVIEYFLGLLGQIKLYHWSTMSYATHKALNELHEELSGLVDNFVETYIGKFNKQPLPNFTVKMEAKSDTSKLLNMLEKERENIRSMHKQLKTSSELQNILDEMMSVINTTIYLCKLK